MKEGSDSDCSSGPAELGYDFTLVAAAYTTQLAALGEISDCPERHRGGGCRGLQIAR